MDEKEPRPKTPLETIREQHTRLVNQYADNDCVLSEDDKNKVRAFLQEATTAANTIIKNIPDRLIVRNYIVDWWLDPLGIKRQDNPYVINLEDKSQKKPRKFLIF